MFAPPLPQKLINILFFILFLFLIFLINILINENETFKFLANKGDLLLKLKYFLIISFIIFQQ